MNMEPSMMVFSRLPKVVGVILLILALAVACKVDSEPIEYGSDACHFCRMTIVDKQHGAELVTAKGKVFKFDAVECMLNHLGDIEDQSVALFLVNTYTLPGVLRDATKAEYLISERIPSPMGEYLTAFENETKAREVQDTYGGSIYSWEEIRNYFKK